MTIVSISSGIRKATILDASHIYAMLLQMHEETEFTIGEINFQKLSECVLAVINNGVTLVAMNNQTIIGSIGGVYTSEWWSDEQFLGDLWFYVYKEHRASKAGINLIKQFLEAGRNMKMKLGHIYSSDLNRKDKFYERLGLQKAGSVYVMENK